MYVSSMKRKINTHWDWIVLFPTHLLQLYGFSEYLF